MWYHLMSDPTTFATSGARTHDLGIISTAHCQLCYNRITLPEGIEPSIYRLTVGRLNHWAMGANWYHFMSDPTTCTYLY